MIQTPTTTVQITFHTPSRANISRSSHLHERCLEGVPETVAQQMTEDFAAYQAERAGAERQKTYTYQHIKGEAATDDETFVALDFGEVVTIKAVEEAKNTETVKG